MNDATNMRVEGFALGRVLPEAFRFELRSAGPQEGQYDPRPRYADGTLVNGGFATKSNRGRPKGTGLGIGHSAEAKAEMVQRYKAGEGLHPLAAAFSTTARRVREIVIQAGVEIRQAGYCRKGKEQRSDDVKLTKDDIREMVRLRDEGQSYKESGKTFGVGQTTVSYHVGKAERGLKHDPKPRPVVATAPEPPHLVDLVAEADTGPGDEAMDDPTPGAAADDSRVIRVHDLTVTAPRTYSPPAVVFDGLLVDLVRPGIVRPGNVMAVSQMVQAMVNELNTIPGVTAFFDFDYRLTAGVRP